MSDILTNETLDAIEARAKAATEWKRDMGRRDHVFLAHALDDVNALVAEVRRLRANEDAIEKAVVGFKVVADKCNDDMPDMGWDKAHAMVADILDNVRMIRGGK